MTESMMILEYLRKILKPKKEQENKLMGGKNDVADEVETIWNSD